jgi:hypothetical protein
MKTLLNEAVLVDSDIYLERSLELPGFFRPTKTWDLLVVSKGALIGAIEFKSQRGPSFGNNFNNRSEEAIGTAKDLWIAYREGAFGKNAVRPWLGWIMLLEDCPKSQSPVKVDEPHFKVFEEFKGASYAKRYEILLRRLVQERLFDSSALLLATETQGKKGNFTEPATDLSMKALLTILAGHVGVHLASR